MLDLFDDFFRPTFNTFFDSNWKKDKDENLVLEIDVPGFNKNNINVELSEGILTIQGETETRKLLKRYQMGNIEDIDANIKDGILSLTLKSLKQEVKKIELKCGCEEEKCDC